MTKYEKMSNHELVESFEQLCFNVTNYPKNKAISKNFEKCEAELISRLENKA